MSRTRYQQGSLKKELRGGEWWWRGIYHPYTSGGKRIKKRVWLGKVSEMTEKLARRAFQPILDKVNTPGAFTVTSSFQQLANEWRDNVLPFHKPSTQASCRTDLKILGEHLGNKSLMSIGRSEIQKMVKNLSDKGYSAKTVRNILATFQMIWNSSDAPHDPTRNARGKPCIVLPKWIKEERPFFTIEQMRMIVAAETREPYKSIYWLFAETGMRSGELFALRAEDVDLPNRTIRVRRSLWNGRFGTPKTEKGVREPLISRKLAAHLESRVKTDGLLFANKKGKHMCANRVRKEYLKPLLKRLGLPEAGFHAFRHGSSTVMEQQNVPEAVRMRRLGHRAMKTTRDYTHAVHSDEARFADLVGDLLTESVH